MWERVIFKENIAFGALRPVSVSAARQRLEAGAAKAPQGRRGQVSFSKCRVKVLHLMRTSPRDERAGDCARRSLPVIIWPASEICRVLLKCCFYENR